jgi:hypothetical protein
MYKHAIGNANKDQASTMLILIFSQLLLTVSVSHLIQELILANSTSMEFVPKRLLQMLTSSTMQLVDLENKNSIQLINVLTLLSLKRMQDKYQLVKLLFFLTLLIVHKKLL